VIESTPLSPSTRQTGSLRCAVFANSCGESVKRGWSGSNSESGGKPKDSPEEHGNPGLPHLRLTDGCVEQGRCEYCTFADFQCTAWASDTLPFSNTAPHTNLTPSRVHNARTRRCVATVCCHDTQCHRPPAGSRHRMKGPTTRVCANSVPVALAAATGPATHFAAATT
jgi:hypothetical protein